MGQVYLPQLSLTQKTGMLPPKTTISTFQDQSLDNQGKRISNAIDKRILKRHHVGINKQQE
jgi:hypothetical protein